MFDLSLPIHDGMPIYPGDSPPRLHQDSCISNGDLLTASTLHINCHVGTHVDAPAHFVPTGQTLDEYPLDRFVGPVFIVDLTDLEDPLILPEHIHPFRIPRRHHILLRTRNTSRLSAGVFDGLIALSSVAALSLAELDPLTVGFDHYSLDPEPLDTATTADDAFPAHVVLARAGIPVIVALDFSSVPRSIDSRDLTFIGFPLRLARNAEGAPVRAALCTRDIPIGAARP